MAQCLRQKGSDGAVGQVGSGYKLYHFTFCMTKWMELKCSEASGGGFEPPYRLFFSNLLPETVENFTYFRKFLPISEKFEACGSKLFLGSTFLKS